MLAKSLDTALLTRPSTDYCNIGRSRGAKLLTARWLSLPAGSEPMQVHRRKGRLVLHERTTDQDALGAIGLINAMLDSALVDVNTNKPDVGVLSNRSLSEKALREAALDTFKKFQPRLESRLRTRPSTKRCKNSGNSLVSRPRKSSRTCTGLAQSTKSTLIFSRRRDLTHGSAPRN